MPETKPTAIRSVGGITIALSVMMVFSNSLFVFFGLDFEETNSDLNTGFDPFNYLNILGYAFILFGVAFFIGGVFLMKYKLWANRLITLIAAISGTTVLLIFFGLAFMIPSEPSFAIIFKIAIVIFALLSATPFLLLIRFLNREKILKHFA